MTSVNDSFQSSKQQLVKVGIFLKRNGTKRGLPTWSSSEAGLLSNASGKGTAKDRCGQSKSKKRTIRTNRRPEGEQARRLPNSNWLIA